MSRHRVTAGAGLEAVETKGLGSLLASPQILGQLAAAQLSAVRLTSAPVIHLLRRRINDPNQSLNADVAGVLDPRAEGARAG